MKACLSWETECGLRRLKSVLERRGCMFEHATEELLSLRKKELFRPIPWNMFRSTPGRSCVYPRKGKVGK